MSKFCLVCDAEFVPSNHVQIYCSQGCRIIATRERALQSYYAQKRKNKNKIRYCAGNCGTVLSVYNDSRLCANCDIDNKMHNVFLRELRELYAKENGTAANS